MIHERDARQVSKKGEECICQRRNRTEIRKRVESGYNALFSNDAVAVIGERHADRTGMFLAPSRSRARALGRLESTRDKMVEIAPTNPQL